MEGKTYRVNIHKIKPKRNKYKIVCGDKHIDCNDNTLAFHLLSIGFGYGSNDMVLGWNLTIDEKTYNDWFKDVK